MSEAISARRLTFMVARRVSAPALLINLLIIGVGIHMPASAG